MVQPAKGKRRDQRSRESKQDILNATIHLLAESGLSAVTVRAVADRAGIGESSIYHFFGSRELLLSATAEELQKRGSELIPLDTGGDRDARRRLLDLVDASVSLIERDPQLLRAANAFQIDGRYVPGLPDLMTIRAGMNYSATIDIFRDAAAAGIIPELHWAALFDFISGAIQGALIRKDLRGEPYDPRELTAFVRKAVMSVLELDMVDSAATGTAQKSLPLRPVQHRSPRRRWRRVDS